MTRWGHILFPLNLLCAGMAAVRGDWFGMANLVTAFVIVVWPVYWEDT